MSYYFALNPRKYYYRIKQSTETGLIFKIMNLVYINIVFTEYSTGIFDRILKSKIGEYRDLLKAKLCDIFYNEFHCVELMYTTN